ncbi:MAG: 4-vinyl reductase [Gemmatimonadota bacterium]|nr:4-vinyl reductase [Gemmatimonadota bacterium]MDH5759070.1 4-vinyl reductase [Gemmatimonadota bacterium]
MEASSTPVAGKNRVRAVVALRLLETLRDQDIPQELMEDEDPTVTMPRRLGLSDVVERQIRSYRADVKRGHRLSDDEIGDLFRLVLRRPDGEDIFFEAGRVLAGGKNGRSLSRVLPRRVMYAVARRRVAGVLRKLFGRRVGAFARGGFVIEGRSLLFIESDPGGDACFLLAGLAQGVLELTAGRAAKVTHTRCQSRGHDLCRWEGIVDDSVEA